MSNEQKEKSPPMRLPDDPDFDAWVHTLDPIHWARYDLSACRLGWEAHKRLVL